MGGAPDKWASYLEGIDFHFDVRHQILSEGTELVRYGMPGSRTGNYFTVRGTATDRLGIDADGRVMFRYRVVAAVDALACRAAPMRYGKPKYDALRGAKGDQISFAHSALHRGGGLQYVVADRDFSSLELLKPGEVAVKSGAAAVATPKSGT
jgi:hypothetical protein